MANLLLLADIASISRTPPKLESIAVQTDGLLSGNNGVELLKLAHQNSPSCDEDNAPVGHDYIKVKDFDILVNSNHDYYNRVTQTDKEKEHSYAFCVENNINDDADCSATLNTFSTDDDPFLEGIANLDQYMGIRDETFSAGIATTFEEAVAEFPNNNETSPYVVFDGVALDSELFSDLEKMLGKNGMNFDDILRYIADDRCVSPVRMIANSFPKKITANNCDGDKCNDDLQIDNSIPILDNSVDENSLTSTKCDSQPSLFVCSWNSCNAGFECSNQLVQHLMDDHLSNLSVTVVVNAKAIENAPETSKRRNLSKTVDVCQQTEENLSCLLTKGVQSNFDEFLTERINPHTIIDDVSTSVVNNFQTVSSRDKNIQIGEGVDHADKGCNCTCLWETCGDIFADLDDLVDHLRESHLNVKQNLWYCKWDGCIKTTCFKHRYLLERHLRIHTNEKPYACERCEKRFATQNRLACHTRVHTGEKPYVCQDCGKAFSSTGDLCRHKNSHSEFSKFSCELCGKLFKCDNGLRIHKKRCWCSFENAKVKFVTKNSAANKKRKSARSKAEFIKKRKPADPCENVLRKSKLIRLQPIRNLSKERKTIFDKNENLAHYFGYRIVTRMAPTASVLF